MICLGTTLPVSMDGVEHCFIYKWIKAQILGTDII
jgi:hypothetical protein